MRLAWLLVVAACHHGAPPSATPTCAAAADHVRGLLGPDAPRAPRIREVFAVRCESDGWDADARQCVVATTSLRNPRHCKAMLTTEQRAALDRELAAVAATPVAVRVPPVCRDYRAMIDKLDACPGLPEGARGALEVKYRELTQGWLRGTYDARTFEMQCRAMIDGLRQATAARCGW
ncbi:MAG: hypothetical protein E6J90_16245 [Deltaproteobacteria bacterium]|nr:MAG: hypothetical protein E6J91_39560 [Deltaproteobacteria bacterium]TMQ20371.1 MAG: hypothetical protein E6J90_16245 [Deltaproteobacteria bacterium]